MAYQPISRVIALLPIPICISQCEFHQCYRWQEIYMEYKDESILSREKHSKANILNLT